MIGDAFILALRELRRNLMRAFLTTLGIVIGVGSVIAIVTLGNGATAKITSSIGALGSNVLILTPGAQRAFGQQPGQGAKPFSDADVAAIAREIPHLRALSPESVHTSMVVAGNRNHSSPVTGIETGYFDAHGTAIAIGRSFGEAELRAGKAVCLLGETVRQQLFGAQDPSGTRLRVGQSPCEVVGVLAAKGKSTFGQDQDDIVLMPLKAVQRRLNGNSDIASVWLAAGGQGDIQQIIAQTQALMRQRRHIAKPSDDDFAVADLAQISQTINQTTGVLAAFLTAIAAVSLLVGGIGIMNIMLVSVTERTREIGIRLAIGARERDVLLQFLVEAMAMSAMGGLVGIVLGLGLSFAATLALKMPYLPSAASVLIAFVFSGVIGMAFGYLPARRAARLDPIEALRHE
jgi:putative ABC transport system permease protein